MDYFIDTNIFIRILELENQKIFNECSSLLKLVKDSKIKAFTSGEVLSEIVWVLSSSYKEPKSKIIKSLKGIVGLNGLKIVDEFDLEYALRKYEGKNIKFIDALIASNPKIQSKKMTVVSYDKDFDKLSIKRVEPSDIINRG
ncbi:MAG: PIN domain-containing protein [Candidatus Microgenomates bacterium]|jgi:predicted nucleic-acid-binding protein